MSDSSSAAEISTLLTLVVRAMVTNREAVKVATIPTGGARTMIQVTAAPGTDRGKLIGKQGRTARSLRIVLQAIAKEQGLELQLDINGDRAASL